MISRLQGDEPTGPVGLEMGCKKDCFKREPEDVAKRLTLNIDLLNLGYDAALQMPREASPAIMPGSMVKLDVSIRCTQVSSLEQLVKNVITAAYIAGLARSEQLSRLGWGTMILLDFNLKSIHA